MLPTALQNGKSRLPYKFHFVLRYLQFRVRQKKDLHCCMYLKHFLIHSNYEYSITTTPISSIMLCVLLLYFHWAAYMLTILKRSCAFYYPCMCSCSVRYNHATWQNHIRIIPLIPLPCGPQARFASDGTCLSLVPLHSASQVWWRYLWYCYSFFARSAYYSKKNFNSPCIICKLLCLPSKNNYWWLHWFTLETLC
jgi:hypothetical protein